MLSRVVDRGAPSYLVLCDVNVGPDADVSD